jgi:uncharacterized membrane protein YfcA
MRRVYYWHQPAIYLTILAGLLVYVIVALVVQKKGTVHVQLCAQHRSKRTRNILLGFLIACSSIAAWVGAAMLDHDEMSPVLIVLGILLLLGGLIAATLSARVLSPSRIDERHLWLKGAGTGFLSNLNSGSGTAQGFPVQYPR